MSYRRMTFTLFLLTAQFTCCASASTPKGASDGLVSTQTADFPVIDVESQAIADGASFDELRKRVDSGKFTLDDISGLCAFRTRHTEILPLLIRQLTTVTPPPQWGKVQAPHDYAIALMDYLDPPHELLIAALKPELAKSPDIRLRQAVELLRSEGLPLLPQLLSDLHSEDGRAAGAQAAIAAMGAAVIDPVWASMEESPATEQWRHLEILRLMGSAASPATTKLLELTTEDDPELVEIAMRILMVIAPDRPEVRSRLVSMLADPKLAESVQGIPGACHVLAGDGTQESLAQMLQYYLAGPVDLPLSYKISFRTLRDAGTVGSSVVMSALEKPTISDDEHLRLSLIAQQLQIDEAAPLLLSQLRRLLTLPPRRDPITRRFIEDLDMRENRLVSKTLASVARLNGDVKQLMSFVTPTGSGKNSEAANVAPRLAVGTVSDADMDVAIRFLQSSFQSKTPSAGKDGCSVCEFLGPRGRDAIPELVRQAEAMSKETYGNVTPYDVLSNIGEPAVPALLKLRQKGGRQEILALLALSRMGSEAQSALKGSDQWLQKPLENPDDKGKGRILKRVVSMIREEEFDLSGRDWNEFRWLSAYELAKLTTLTDHSLRDRHLWAYRGRWATTRPPRLTDAEKASLREMVIAESALAAAMLALCGETVPELSQLLEADWKQPRESRTLRFLADTAMWYDGEDRKRLLSIVRNVHPEVESPGPDEPGCWLRLEANPQLARHPGVASFLDDLNPDLIGHPLILTRAHPDTPLIRGLWKKVPFACGQLRNAWRHNTSQHHDKARFLSLLNLPVSYWCFRQVPCSEWNANSLFEDLSWFDESHIRAESLAGAVQLIDFSSVDCDKAPDTLSLWSAMIEWGGGFDASRSLWTIRPNAESASLIAEKLGLTHRGLFNIRDNVKTWAMFDDVSAELRPRLEELKRESREHASAEVRFKLRRLVRNIESAPGPQG